MSELTDETLSNAAEWIKSEATTATRPGQMASLDRLADVVEEGAYRLAAVTARAEAAEAKIARVEALTEEATERAYLGIAIEKMLTIQIVGPERAQVPPHWRDAAEFAAIVQVPDLRAALADEGDTHE